MDAERFELEIAPYLWNLSLNGNKHDVVMSYPDEKGMVTMLDYVGGTKFKVHESAFVEAKKVSRCPDAYLQAAGSTFAF